jgi:hypothetical protein
MSHVRKRHTSNYGVASNVDRKGLVSLFSTGKREEKKTGNMKRKATRRMRGPGGGSPSTVDRKGLVSDSTKLDEMQGELE